MSALARDAVREGAGVIKISSTLTATADARRDATSLLEFVLGRTPSPEDRVPAAAERRYRELIRRRAEGEPVAWITRRTTFAGLSLEAGPGAWVPRRASELLARRAVELARKRPRTVHVDVATGIGPIALAVATKVPGARVVGVDLSAPAIALAKRNARRLGAHNVQFYRGNLFSPLPKPLKGSVDLITANAPYLSRGDVRWLQSRVSVREPVEAITASSASGLELVKRIADEAGAWLAPRGRLVIQVSSPVSRQVAALMRRAGLEDVRIEAGPPMPRANRLVIGRR